MKHYYKLDNKSRETPSFRRYGIAPLFLRSVVSLTAIFISHLLCGMEDGRPPTNEAMRTDATRNREVLMKEMVSKMIEPNFATSLEMKENADFLLTPALLVQDTVSEHVVITYPQQ